MKLQNHVFIRRSDRYPNAPTLSLELSLLEDNDREMRSLPSALNPFGIQFTVRHEGCLDEAKTITIEWESADAMRHSGFVLLHNTKEGLQRCNVPNTLFGGERDRVGRIKIAQGSKHTRKHMLSYEYHKLMKSGESYVFFWPGGEVCWSDWQSSNNHNHEDGACRADDLDDRALASIIIPASNTLEFIGTSNIELCPERPLFERAPFHVANHMEAMWRRRKDRRVRIPAPRYLTECDRPPCSPILTKTIQGPSRVMKSQSHKITEITTYVVPEGQSGEELEPITFMDCGIIDSMDHYCASLFSILPLSSNEVEALQMGNVNWGFPVHDHEPDQDIETSRDDQVREFFPASHEWCHTLYPGQSISLTCDMYPFDELEEILHVGARYCYRFNGKVIRWWDWGTKEDHSTTRVQRGDMEGSGRPRLILPSTSFNFEVIL